MNPFFEFSSKLKQIQHWSQHHPTNASLIVGAHSGLGLEVAKQLAKAGRSLILTSHDPEKIAETEANLKFQTGNEQITGIHLDYCDLANLRRFTQLIIGAKLKIDYLLNAIDFACYDWELTKDGLEKTIAINHAGPLLLVQQLAPQFIEHETRILFFNSAAYRYGKIEANGFYTQEKFNTFDTYCNAKLANAVAIASLARSLTGRGIKVNGFAPVSKLPLTILKAKLLEQTYLHLRPYLIHKQPSTEQLVMLSDANVHLDVTGSLFINGKTSPFTKKVHTSLYRKIALQPELKTTNPMKRKSYQEIMA